MTAMDLSRRVIVALDFDTAEAAAAVVERLGEAARSYKVGLELLTAAGPALAAGLADAGKDVFFDLKLFEIPSSVAAAVRAAGRHGATMVSVHATAGARILEAAVRAAAEFPRLRIVALTVVTSLTAADLAEVGVGATTGEQSARLALLARRAGCHGVVAAPHEAAALRRLLGPGQLIVTPGVTLPGGPGDTDHARPAHPVAAVRAGASHVVIGRALTRTPDPAAVLAGIIGDLRAASE
ncbi:orotidine-5'-phosphate decarboxylase [Dactylosporangium sp. NPDC005555]|uniref:orotidine-5'-phosphate decarboxylase n=1 Tax=Dactylosporangium sp. NPDC005555 TaxID=3154889 RepID=UPI0033A33CF9